MSVAAGFESAQMVGKREMKGENAGYHELGQDMYKLVAATYLD